VLSILQRWKPRFAGLAIVLACINWCAQAAPPEKTVRVGLLLSGFPPHYVEAERAFVDGLRSVGYVEGRNLVIERRYGELQFSKMQGIARELAAMNLDAIVTGCTGSTRAAQQATTTMPVIMASVADPVGQGFVTSLARPGTNATGRSSQSRELMPKMFELLHTAVPKAKRIAVLVQIRNTVHDALWQDAVAAAASLGVTAVRIELDGAPGLDTALDKLRKAAVQAVVALPDDPPMMNLRTTVVAAANTLRLPSLFGYREFVAEGGLMSYGEPFTDGYRYVAPYIDKVVRGGRPAELPIEQPMRFELVINLKTAAMLGLDLPKALLLRANETIR
jgi:putative ABC transport system substrate-binding protein